MIIGSERNKKWAWYEGNIGAVISCRDVRGHLASESSDDFELQFVSNYTNRLYFNHFTFVFVVLGRDSRLLYGLFQQGTSKKVLFFFFALWHSSSLSVIELPLLH